MQGATWDKSHQNHERKGAARRQRDDANAATERPNGQQASGANDRRDKRSTSRQPTTPRSPPTGTAVRQRRFPLMPSLLRCQTSRDARIPSCHIIHYVSPAIFCMHAAATKLLHAHGTENLVFRC